MENIPDNTEKPSIPESEIQFQDAQSLVKHMKTELKNGKHIPLGVPFDQEIVDSFNVTKTVFDSEIIKKKGKNEKRYFSQIFINLDDRKLNIKSLGAGYPNYILPIAEVKKEDIKDFDSYSSEIKIHPVYGGAISPSYKLEISITSAQTLLQQIADLTLGNNAVDDWLDS